MSKTIEALTKAIDVIKRWEGCKYEAYAPPEGTANGWAIGFGYTRPWVTRGCRISPEWAEVLLRDHLDELFDDLTGALSGCPHRLSDNELAAILSLVYNIGIGAFRKSTMRRLLLNGRFSEAAEEFDRWTKAGGKVLPGLVKRRAEEKALFLLKE